MSYHKEDHHKYGDFVVLLRCHPQVHEQDTDLECAESSRGDHHESKDNLYDGNEIIVACVSWKVLTYPVFGANNDICGDAGCEYQSSEGEPIIPPQAFDSLTLSSRVDSCKEADCENHCRYGQQND